MHLFVGNQDLLSKILFKKIRHLMRGFCAVEPRKQNIEHFFLQVTVYQNENFLISSSFNETD